MILNNLSLDDRKNSSLVCKKWNIMSFPRIYTENLVLNIKDTTDIEILHCSQRKFQNLKLEIMADFSRRKCLEILSDYLDSLKTINLTINEDNDQNVWDFGFSECFKDA